MARRYSTSVASAVSSRAVITNLRNDPIDLPSVLPTLRSPIINSQACTEMDRRVTTRRYVTRNDNEGFSSLRRRGEDTQHKERKGTPVAKYTRRHREESVSRAEGGRDYRSWAGKPRINR